MGFLFGVGSILVDSFSLKKTSFAKKQNPFHIISLFYLKLYAIGYDQLINALNGED